MSNYAAAQKSTSVSLAALLLEEAKAPGIDVSQAAEEVVALAVARRRREQWLQEFVLIAQLFWPVVSCEWFKY